MIQQRTLQKPVSASGIGLHSGHRVNLTMKPAPLGSGIVFRRVDLAPEVDLPVSPTAVGGTVMATRLQKDNVSVSTIEHLMAALWGLGIDNLIVEVDSQEIPILDGSSAPFIYLLESAGIEEQAEPKRFVKILREIEVRKDDKWARLSPHEGFRLQFTIQFDHQLFRHLPCLVDQEMSPEIFIRHVAQARTFGFVRDVATMRANGLALGGGLNNAIVVGDRRILNEGGLRLPDEFVRHKVLDAIGDLYVIGHPIIGAFCANKSGHALNNDLLRALLNSPDSWEYVEWHNQSAAIGQTLKYTSLPEI